MTKERAPVLTAEDQRRRPHRRAGSAPPRLTKPMLLLNSICELIDSRIDTPELGPHRSDKLYSLSRRLVLAHVTEERHGPAFTPPRLTETHTLHALTRREIATSELASYFTHLTSVAPGISDDTRQELTFGRRMLLAYAEFPPPTQERPE